MHVQMVGPTGNWAMDRSNVDFAHFGLLDVHLRHTATRVIFAGNV